MDFKGLTMNKTLLASLLLASFVANAETSPQNTSQTKGILGGGFAFGGDTLIEDIEFTNGDSEDVKAGDGFWIEAGFKTQFETFALKGTLGYKTGGVFARNGDATFSHFPLTFVGSVNNGNHNFGLGVTHHLSPELDIDLPYVYGSVDADNATGFVLEYEYDFGNWALGGRYTNIEYTFSEGGYSEDYDGSNVGVFAIWYF